MEIFVLAQCKHDNIIQLIRIDGPDIILEDGGVPLLDWPDVRLLPGIEAGMKYLHAHGILHLDLKPDNIVVNNDIAKIIDFGSSGVNGEWIGSPRGTVTHRPPWTMQVPYPQQVDPMFDYWSFGITVYEVVSRLPVHLCSWMPVYTGDEVIFEIIYLAVIDDVLPVIIDTIGTWGGYLQFK